MAGFAVSVLEDTVQEVFVAGWWRFPKNSPFNIKLSLGFDMHKSLGEFISDPIAMFDRKSLRTSTIWKKVYSKMENRETTLKVIAKRSYESILSE